MVSIRPLRRRARWECRLLDLVVIVAVGRNVVGSDPPPWLWPGGACGRDYGRGGAGSTAATQLGPWSPRSSRPLTTVLRPVRAWSGRP